MFPETVPDVAVIVVVPTLFAVANPCEPGAVKMIATEASDEVQVTVVVRSCAELSENTPSALNCATVPMLMIGLGGVTIMDVSSAAVTVRVTAFDVTPLKLALTDVVPTDRAVARPFVPAALPTVATCVLFDVQVADAVMSFLEPSEYAPIAVNCCTLPTATLELTGVIEIDDRTAGVTVSTAEFEDTPPNDAVIEVEPVPADTASPGDVVPVPMVATVGVDELHTA